MDQKRRAKLSKLKMRKLHPERYKARNAVNNALRDGKIRRAKECKFCGLPVREEKGYHRLQAHHHDYKKPLDVWWVHPKCHDSWHFPEGGNAES
jgi:hypothetical protein